ncbi:type II and III secretion system protein family protein [Corticibacter populi]|uniref:type II and III secretion system protein family protein n=1 Tax=Corticibacter populi TaxID=1550736 RepID=UPI0013C30A5B|nr:pilus assembly protein N-terminal domain-containing protein [Corticibacter populi]
MSSSAALLSALLVLCGMEAHADAPPEFFNAQPPAAAQPSAPRATTPRLAAATKSNLTLYAGQVKVLNQADVERVAIGNGALLTASVLADRQIVLLGEKPGATTLHVWLRGGRQLTYEVTITADITEKTAFEMQQLLLAYPEIRVKAVGERIVLDGSYPTSEAAVKVGKILEAYPQVLNLIDDRPGDMTVHPDQMVQLDVKVVEVRKQALDNIGIKWSNLGVAGPTLATSGYFYANTTWRGTNQDNYPTTNSSRPFVTYFGLATQITSVLNFLESNGDSWTLAEPRISSVSGGISKVQVGGEIPIPVNSGFGQISVAYKPYGVMLDFRPVIDKSGNVRSTIIAEVSQPDRSYGTGDFVAFTTNRTETEVSLKEGETLVISGLLKNVGARNKEGIPVVGRAPVVGRLFSSEETSNEQTEMLVVVTPRLHAAAADREATLAGEAAYRNMNAVKSMIETKLER